MLCQLLFDGVAVFLFLPWLLLSYRRWERRHSYGRFAALDGQPPVLDTPDFYQYLGFPAVALALLGVFVAHQQRALRFLPAALALSFLLCLPGPWMAFLAELPPLSFIQMIYLYVIFVGVVAAAAAVGFDWLRLRSASRVPGLVFAIAALAIVGANVLRGLYVFTPVPAEPIPESEAYRLLRADGDTFRITGLWGQNHLPNISNLTGLEDLRIISVTMNPRYHAWFELVDPAVMAKTYPNEACVCAPVASAPHCWC